MKYKTVKQASFIKRPNRFNAVVSLDGERTTVHVKNTGRCRELLLPGSKVYLSKAENPQRKTGYDLVAVEKRREDGSVMLINMDSQLPNDAVFEWLPSSGLFSANAVIRREVTHGDSRFDFYVEDTGIGSFIEVKGVTLEKDGCAMFPDAPTERGVKHLRGLASSLKKGYNGIVIFVIQMKGVRKFMPNDLTDPDFASALRDAASAGVRIIAVDCVVTPDSVTVDREVEIEL